MKKILLSGCALVCFVVMSSSVFAQGALIANSAGYVAPGCQWVVDYSGSPGGQGAPQWVTAKTLKCGSASVATHVVLDWGGSTTCNGSFVGGSSYSFSGSICGSYTIYESDPPELVANSGGFVGPGCSWVTNFDGPSGGGQGAPTWVKAEEFKCGSTNVAYKTVLQWSGGGTTCNGGLRSGVSYSMNGSICGTYSIYSN